MNQLYSLIDPIECQCEKCLNACKSKPGWFLPNEVEKVATYLNLSLAELFKTKLGIDWWESYDNPEDEEDDQDIFILTPAITTMNAGSEYPANPKGKCIFLKDNLCSIHQVKPFECRLMNCKKTINKHKEVAESWLTHQKFINTLLGKSPKAKSYSFLQAMMF